jgi:hypothetical protein
MQAPISRVTFVSSVLTVILASSLPLKAWAQTPQFLTKEQTEAIARGKIWEMIRYSDGDKIRVEFRANGWGYAYNARLKGTDTGKWYVSDKGYLCATWRNDSGVETCAMIQKAPDKYVIFMTDRPQAAAYEFTTP